MLDIFTPEHRNALRRACSMGLEERARATAFEVPIPGPLQRAMRALSSPTESAAIVRAELERCEIADVLCLAYDYRGSERVDISVPGFLFVCDAKSIPALILRLLSCTTREEALAALSEVGK